RSLNVPHPSTGSQRSFYEGADASGGSGSPVYPRVALLGFTCVSTVSHRLWLTSEFLQVCIGSFPNHTEKFQRPSEDTIKEKKTKKLIVHRVVSPRFTMPSAYQIDCVSPV